MQELAADLAGTPLVFASADAPLLESVGRATAPLRIEGHAAGGFRCTLRFGDPAPVPSDACVHFEGVAPFGEEYCVLGEHCEERFLVFPGRLSLFASLTRRVAHAIIEPGEERAFALLPLMHLLDWVLEADGQTLLHGAALAHPRGERGILFFAPSGVGKTTLALALLKAGFRLYSDDLAVLSRKDGISRIGGLARPLKVHRETARLMPWLHEHLGESWDKHGEQPLVPDVAARIGTLAREPVPLAAVVSLAGRGSAHALVPAASAEILMRLCAENLRMGMGGAPDFERRSFRRLAAILAGVPVYELSVGSDVESVAPLIAGLVP